MNLKGVCFKAGGYARRNDPYRREYYSDSPRRTGPPQTPASSNVESPIGGCGVALFMFGGLMAFVFPPLAVLFILAGGLLSTGSAVASNRQQPTQTTGPVPAPVPSALTEQPQIEPGYSRCVCDWCGQTLEFPSHGAGETITCPTCQHQTMLHRDPELSVV